MQNQNQVLDDLSRLMSSIAGTLAGAGREAESRLRDRLRQAIGGLDMVSREEFEAMKAMAAETRAELEAMKARLADTAPADPMPAATPLPQTDGNNGHTDDPVS